MSSTVLSTNTTVSTVVTQTISPDVIATNNLTVDGDLVVVGDATFTKPVIFTDLSVENLTAVNLTANSFEATGGSVFGDLVYITTGGLTVADGAVTVATGDLTMTSGTIYTYGISQQSTAGLNIGSFGEKLSFFGGDAINKPTGVGVDVAEIHAALVSLGLIAE